MTKRPAPKRYYNIRIDEKTYKLIHAAKAKEASIVDFLRCEMEKNYPYNIK